MLKEIAIAIYEPEYKPQMNWSISKADMALLSTVCVSTLKSQVANYKGNTFAFRAPWL